MFRQDPAWTKSMRLAPKPLEILPVIPETTSTSETPSRSQTPTLMGTFESELERINEMMSGSPQKSMAEKTHIFEKVIDFEFVH